jgi:hypothetical protein
MQYWKVVVVVDLLVVHLVLWLIMEQLNPRFHEETWTKEVAAIVVDTAAAERLRKVGIAIGVDFDADVVEEEVEEAVVGQALVLVGY